MSVEKLLSENGLTPLDLETLSVINDLTLATISQVKDILGLPSHEIKNSFLRLSKSIISRFGFPSLQRAHPLCGSYYGCLRSDLGDALLPGYYRWARVGYARSSGRSGDRDGLYFRSRQSDSHVYYFSNHAAIVNFSAAWVLSEVRKSLGWNLIFEGEQSIRHVRKWHYGRVVTLSDKAAGVPMAVPDFLLSRDARLLCVEVELNCKSQRVYEAYYDHLDQIFSVLYLVPNVETAKKILRYIPKRDNVDYAVLTDTDGMIRSVSSLFP